MIPPLAAVVPLLVLLLWAPLPFGSVTPGFAAALQIAAFALLAVSPWLGGRRRPPGAALWIAAALAGVAALGLLQSLAWPAPFVRALSPGHARLAGESAALADEAAPRRVALSLAPASSRAAALDWLLPAAGLLAAAQLGAARRARRALAAAVVGAALCQVVYGAQSWLARSNAIWGVETALDSRRLRGTFVNPNHLALALELALAVAFAALWWSARRAAAERSPEARLLRLGPAALVAGLLFAALAFTGSRSGMLAALVALALQLALQAASRRRRRWALAAGAAALALGATAVALADRGGAFSRLLETSGADASLQSRLDASARSLDLWRLFPATGSGLGSFRAAFPLVQGPDLPGVWRHAHDDWVELAATTGVAGVALGALALAALVRGLGLAWRRAERSEDRAAVAAAVGALVSAALHAGTDFGLTLPANAWTLSVVVGAALAVGVRPEGRAFGSGTAAGQPPEATEDQPAEEPSSKPSAKRG
jgi:O-antigen ligase